MSSVFEDFALVGLDPAPFSFQVFTNGHFAHGDPFCATLHLSGSTPPTRDLFAALDEGFELCSYCRSPFASGVAVNMLIRTVSGVAELARASERLLSCGSQDALDAAFEWVGVVLRFSTRAFYGRVSDAQFASLHASVASSLALPLRLGEFQLQALMAACATLPASVDNAARRVMAQALLGLAGPRLVVVDAISRQSWEYEKVNSSSFTLLGDFWAAWLAEHPSVSFLRYVLSKVSASGFTHGDEVLEVDVLGEILKSLLHVRRSGRAAFIATELFVSFHPLLCSSFPLGVEDTPEVVEVFDRLLRDRDSSHPTDLPALLEMARKL